MSADFADAERNAQYWRMHEAEARIIASKMSDPGPKHLMLGIAEAYKRLAERAELRHPVQPIARPSFGPEELKAMGEAFEAAWAEIADNFSNITVERETARVKLATALLSVALEDGRDVQVLKQAALQRMALDYRSI